MDKLLYTYTGVMEQAKEWGEAISAMKVMQMSFI